MYNILQHLLSDRRSGTSTKPFLNLLIKFLATRSPMLRLGRGTFGCKTCVEIPAQGLLQTSPKVAQLFVSSGLIRPGRLSQHFLSSCI